MNTAEEGQQSLVRQLIEVELTEHQRTARLRRGRHHHIDAVAYTTPIFNAAV